MGDVSKKYFAKAQQHPAELAAFVDYVKALQPKSYLEIGCKFGGLTWAVAQVMPPGSRIVGVDLPNSHWGRSESLGSLQECFKHLGSKGHHATLFIGDSTTAAVIDNVQRLGPYDLVFIDANHTEKYVRTDFENYGWMGKVICFHDIAWNNPTLPGRMAIEVPKVWAEIKATFCDRPDDPGFSGAATFKEIKLDTKWNGTRDESHNGIGILEWR